MFVLPRDAPASPGDAPSIVPAPRPPGKKEGIASLPFSSNPAIAPSTLPLPPAPGVPNGANTPAPNPKLALAAQKFEQAGSALKSGNKKGALALWEEVARLAPDDLATRQNLALVYGELNQPKAAVPHARAAVKLAPKNPAAQFQLARVLLADKQVRAAVAPLRAAVQLAPQEREGHALLARVLVTLKQPKDALAQWAFLANKNGKDLEAHINAATIANDLLRNPTESQKWLRRSVAQNPRDPQAPLMLSQLLLRRDPKGAARVLKQAVQNSPDAFALYPALAQVLVSGKDRPGAINALRGGLARLPKGATNAEGRLRVTLGQLLGDGKQPRAARDEFNRAAKLLPRDPEPLALAALAELDLKNPSGAAKLIGQAVALDPKNGRTRRLYAQTLAQSKQWKAADAQYALVCAAAPRDKEALAQWARVAHEAKNPVREIEVLRRLAAVEPRNPRVWEQLGSVQLAGGNKGAAINSFAKVVSLSPRDTGSALNLADLQIQQGDARAALGTLQQAIGARPDFAPAYARVLDAGDKANQKEACRDFVAGKLAAQSQNGALLATALGFYDIRKRSDEARALLDEVLSRNPNAALAKRALASYNPTTPAPDATKAP